MILNKLLLAFLTVSAGVLCDIKGEFEQKHMHEDHQIEITDEVTFFKLHDLDNDGFWGEQELKWMYGLERDIDPDASHIKLIIERVFEDMDTNKDRYISLEEYIASKLPSISKKEKQLEEEIKEETQKKKKKSNSKDSNTNGQQQKVIINNKRSPSSKKEPAVREKEKVFNQEGSEYIPNKFRV